MIMVKNSERKSPPKWPDKLLEKFCSADLLEEIMGDLHERFEIRAKRDGYTKAKRAYLKEVVAYIRPSFFGRSKHSKPNNMDMLSNHFKIAIRAISRGRSFSAINILGLAFGISCSLLIYFWVQGERQVDGFHANGDDLYTVYYSEFSGDNANGGYSIPFEFISPSFDYNRSLADDLKESIPEVKYATSYATSYELPWGHACTFRYNDHQYKMEGGATGGDFFKMFSYNLIVGDKETVLREPNEVVISRKMSEIFFDGPEDAIGKVLRYENFLNLEVTGVFENVGAESTLRFDYLISWENWKQGQILSSNSNFITYTQLKEHSDPDLVDGKIRGLLDERLADYPDIKVELGLQQFRDQYLISNFVEGKPVNGQIEYVNIFSWVALFVLLVASINFMNLTTARSVKRAKEVGVRKVIGSSQNYLTGQFLVESWIMVFLATISAIVIAFLAKPIFRELTGKSMMLPAEDPIFWFGLFMLTIAISLFSGLYPALFLSSMKPSVALKGLLRFKGRSAWLQKGLVIFQFSLSILMLIATVVVSWQTNFVKNTHLGYDKQNLITVRIEGALAAKSNYLLLKNKLLPLPGINMVDRSSEAPHSMAFEMASPFSWQGKDESGSVGFLPTSVGYDFINLMNLDLVEGRDFDKRIASDTTAFMVNETALKQMNMKDPLGKWISAWNKKGTIIGILKDYHTHSLHDPIKPLIVDVKEDLNFGLIMIKTEPGKTEEAIASMEQVFGEVNPDYPLEFKFLDQEYAAMYRSEQVVSRLSNGFAALAIIISCLGLLGLAMFSAEQRVKEIGIRKVLGASVKSIIAMFSKDFLLMVAISFLVAAPIAWLLLDSWLSGFAYRVNLAWWIFAGTGLVTLLIALLTISIQALKSASSNPVDSLRAE